ncbi:AAA family ATPase [Staphylococcus borealis]|uniref:AAA family ATPase n=1 Tax=Staphylococcus borealis TaxID=2742203 RepID=UPI000FEDE62B|nr:ATP-binding protein [Staphylococcus borealis]MDM7862363.1 ATP-binding protein [Staphylococcus borealis]MDM7881176.1 ATP-binding protein [Staphylococcus borealis]RIO87352.1 AAA family ATPase [Staphylococcus haemolyticus]
MKIKNHKLVNELIKYIETNVSLVFLQGYEKEILNALNFIKKESIVDEINEFSIATDGNTDDIVVHLKESNQLKYELIQALNSSFTKNKSTLLVVHGGERYLNSNENGELIDIFNRITQLTNYNEFSSNLTIIFSGKDYEIPNLLRENSILLKKQMPKKKDIERVIIEFIENNKLPLEIEEILSFSEKLSERMNGLSEIEINQLLRFLYYDNGIQLFKKTDDFLEVITKEIRELKVQKLIKLGTLTIEKVNVSFNDVSGLKNLKAYIEKKKEVINSFNQLDKFNISLPKGILLLGEPGTGKSLSAKAIANELNVELIKFDISQILGKYVGESEKRMRETLETIQYMSPCILWIDEIEKAFAGVNKDNNEIMRKVFGQLLTWMSENDKGVYVVATANNIEGILPPEFLRKGRFDEIFYIDRPTSSERLDIIKLHLSKRKINVEYIEENFSTKLNEVLLETQNLVGADLEYCCNEFAINYHFNKENIDDDVNSKIEKCFKSLEEDIAEIQEKIKRKGTFLSLKNEIENIQNHLSEEIDYLASNNKGNYGLEEIVNKVIKDNIYEKLDYAVKNTINKSNNRKLYKPATNSEEI